MARNRVTAPTFLEAVLREVGEVVDYTGDPGSALTPLDAASAPSEACQCRAVKAYRARRTAAVAASQAAEEQSSAASLSSTTPPFSEED
jgi:hypothetical protein